ncbi:hypothetical protein EXIGLDRAFT_729590 [Exidia glandulosa HHB12029]|uniref:Methyltransferase n=1 Tax=Exidia glandulosa HHB12029 TaxID=1314781 RepID=A0A165CHL7_EXIGL|nr:hypothetical protein EXIGLDRAFT_729590 [Exidia glandulosa HHB12029]
MPSLTAVPEPPQHQSVAAELIFLSPLLKEKPFHYRAPPPAGKPVSNVVTESQVVNITDLRTLSEGERKGLTIDSAGFQIVEHKSSMAEKDFLDEAVIRDAYYKECAELLQSITGAGRIFIYDHTVRRVKPGEAESAGNRRPGLGVHGDQTPKAGAAQVYLHLGEEAERLSKGRVQIINVWRPIKPVVATPLSYGDYRTFDANKDLVGCDLFYPDRDGEIYNVKHNAAQKWYYMKDQTPEETVLLKCYESEEKPGRALMTPHSAFIDPTVPADAPARESIEVRALVFYDN